MCYWLEPNLGGGRCANEGDGRRYSGSKQFTEHLFFSFYTQLKPSRQRLTIKGERKALVDEKRLSDVLGSDADGWELQVKDLGPQVSWKTVFIVEYVSLICSLNVLGLGIRGGVVLMRFEGRLDRCLYIHYFIISQGFGMGRMSNIVHCKSNAKFYLQWKLTDWVS